MYQLPRHESGRLKKIPKKYRFVFRELRKLGFTYQGIADLYKIEYSTIKKVVEDIKTPTLYMGSYRVELRDRKTDELVETYTNIKELSIELNVSKQRIYRTIGLGYYSFRTLDREFYVKPIFLNIEDYAKRFEKQFDIEHRNDFEW